MEQIAFFTVLFSKLSRHQIQKAPVLIIETPFSGKRVPELFIAFDDSVKLKKSLDTEI
jgi:hypothetical protein